MFQLLPTPDSKVFRRHQTAFVMMQYCNFHGWRKYHKHGNKCVAFCFEDDTINFEVNSLSAEYYFRLTIVSGVVSDAFISHMTNEMHHVFDGFY